MAAALARMRSAWTRLPAWLAARADPELAPAVLAPYRPVRTRREDRKRRRRLLIAIILVGMIYGFLVSIFPVAWYLYMAMPILLLGGLVVWALPETESFPELGLERLLFAAFIASFIWPNYLALQIPGLPWITVVRLFAAPLTLLFLYSLSVSPTFRARVRDSFSAAPWLYKLMIAFVVIQVLTLPMSNHLGASFNRLLDAQFGWTVMLFVSAVVFAKRGRSLAWSVILCGMAVNLSFLAILEVRYEQVLWAGQVPSFLAVGDESVLRILGGGRRMAIGLYRSQSIFTTSLNFAEFIGLTVAFFIYFIGAAKNVVLKTALIAYVPFAFWVIRSTDSRLGVVAFFATILIYLFMSAYRKWRRSKESLVAPFVIVIYPAIAVGFYILSLVWQRLGRMIWGGGAQQASNDARELQYEMGFKKILEWPIGNGIGESGFTLGFFNPSGAMTIDSYYLAIALDYGVLGFLAYYGMIIYAAWIAFWGALESRETETDLLMPLFVMLLVFLILKGVLAQDDSHTLVFMALGMVAGLTHRVKQARIKPA